jgi:hypothetical protein
MSKVHGSVAISRHYKCKLRIDVPTSMPEPSPASRCAAGQALIARVLESRAWRSGLG